MKVFEMLVVWKRTRPRVQFPASVRRDAEHYTRARISRTYPIRELALRIRRLVVVGPHSGLPAKLELRSREALDGSLEMIVKLDICTFWRGLFATKIPGRDDQLDIVQPDARHEKEKFLNGGIADGKTAG